MEEFLKLENLYKEIQLIENAEEKEALMFLYNHACAQEITGSPDSMLIFAVMQDMNMKHQKIDDMKLVDFFHGYEMKMMGGDQ